MQVIQRVQAIELNNENQKKLEIISKRFPNSKIFRKSAGEYLFLGVEEQIIHSYKTQLLSSNIPTFIMFFDQFFFVIILFCF